MTSDESPKYDITVICKTIRDVHDTSEEKNDTDDDVEIIDLTITTKMNHSDHEHVNDTKV